MSPIAERRPHLGRKAIKLAPLKENSTISSDEGEGKATISAQNTTSSRPPLGQMSNVPESLLLPDTRKQPGNGVAANSKSVEKNTSPVVRIPRSTDRIKTGSPRTGLLRYGERMEDLCGIPHSTPWDDPFYRKCRQLYTIEEGPATKTDEQERCQVWLDVLQEAQARKFLKGSALVRLFRRATSRLPWKKDSVMAPLLLEVWLSYVRVLAEHDSLSDAQLTLRHLGAHESAAYHIVVAEIEERNGKNKVEIVTMLKNALALGAKPTEALTKALEDRTAVSLEGHDVDQTAKFGKRSDSFPMENATKRARLSMEVAEPMEQRDKGLPTAELDNKSLDDSNMSLDDDEDEATEASNSDTIKWKTSVKIEQQPQRQEEKIESKNSDTSQSPEQHAATHNVMHLPSSDRPVATEKPSSVVQEELKLAEVSKSTTLNTNEVKQTPVKSSVPAVRNPQSHSILSRQRRSFMTVHKLPRLTKLSGKAQRADPNQSTIADEDESMNDCTSQSSNTKQSTTSAAKQGKPSLSKVDLSYIFEWNPNKRFEEQKLPDLQAPTSTAISDSSCSNHSKEQKDQDVVKKDPNDHKGIVTALKPNDAKETSNEKDELKLPLPIDKSQKTESEPILAKKPPSVSAESSAKPRKSGKSQHSEINQDFLPLVSERNTLRINGASYVKLGVVGKGGSCKVYRALSKDCTVVAIKKVKTDGLNQKAIESYANEIALLKSLRGNPAIIQMYDSQVDLQRKAIFVVMEVGEVDLNHVLQQQTLLVNNGGGVKRLNMNFVRLTWYQMLSAVHGIHEARIIHGDLKPANFLFVRGALKLIDFGIAKAIQSDDTTNIYRENQIGTLNYMSPEAIIEGDHDPSKPKLKLGRASDIWSLGCILYQMVYGKTPFAHLHIIPKLQAIINPNHRIDYPDDVEEGAIDAIQACLKRKPEERLPIIGPGGLLNEHVFLNPPKQKR